MIGKMTGGVGFVVLLFVNAAGLGRAQSETELPLRSKLTSLGLFKNGLAVLRHEAVLEKPGVYRMNQAPTPLHGTYWVEASANLETQVLALDVDVSFAESGTVDLEGDLVGKTVTLHFQREGLAPLRGTVVERRRLAPPGDGGEPPPPVPLGGPRPSDDFLIVESGERRTYVRSSLIAYIETVATPTVRRKQPVLLLKAGADATYPLQVRISYLARGLSWAPSYRVDISDPKKLRLEQSAVVRNELAPFTDVEMYLISGFPSVQFGHVRSPLAADTTWTRFFSELGQDPRGGRGGQMLMTQQVAFNIARERGNFDIAAFPADQPDDGIDLHYQPIGPRSLGRQSALAVTVAREDADYERIVEWLIPDTRDAYGNQTQTGQTDDDSAWDALKFKNPFAFPMTSAPAFVVSGGRFGGQRLSTWVNKGEETLLRVNKALSIRTRATEAEVQTPERPGTSDRDVIWIGGRRYRQAMVEGEITVAHQRREAVKMQIRRRFSGDLVSADAEPKVTLREEGAWSVNRRNELSWELTIEPGQERKLVYKYRLLVAF